MGVKRPRVIPDMGKEEAMGRMGSGNDGGRGVGGGGGKEMLGGEGGSQEKLLHYGETSLSLEESTSLIRK